MPWRTTVCALFLTLGSALGCSRPTESPRITKPTSPPDPVNATGTPPLNNSVPTRKLSTVATLRGIVVDGTGMDGNPVREICPGRRVAACPGVEVRGDVPPPLISTPKRVVPVIVQGEYDGATLRVQKVDADTPLSDEPSERYRNPCPEYQALLTGPVNGPETLRLALERLQQAYDSRVSGIWWDRPRQTLAVRMTGDVSDIKEYVKSELKLKRGERLCIVGGATITRAEGSHKIERLHRLLEPTEALFLSGGLDEVSGRARIQLEAVDAATREIIVKEVGPDVELEAFIELVDARLEEMPLPPARGAFPLVTSPARSSSAMMHALGRFSLHADRARSCVYLKGGTDEDTRVQPLLPFGYAVLDGPLRLVDYDGRVVAVEGERTDWGGGNVGSPSAASTVPDCGAVSAWSGAPMRREL